MTVAANIDEAIAFGPGNVTRISQDPVLSLLTQTNLWIQGMYRSGIFDVTIRNQRNVSDWEQAMLRAQRVVASQGAGALDTNSIAEGEVIDALNRSLWAVKYATLQNYITAGQQTSVLAAYNAAWG